MGLVRRASNLLRTLLGSVIAAGFALFAGSLVSLYEFLGRDSDSGNDVHDLSVAYGIAWVGITFSLVAVVLMMIGKLRTHRPIAWTPILAVPLIAGSWILGALAALVLVSI